jgi:putative ABC transport system permease protein
VETVEIGWRLAVVLVVLAVVAALVARAAGIGTAAAPIRAALRAAAQLAAVSAVIAVVLEHLALTLLFVLVMTVVGAATAARRVTGRLGPGAAWFWIPIAGGAVGPVALTLAAGVVPLEPVAVLPVAGIVVGGAMSATTLAGRRVTDELVEHRGSYDAALALGFARRAAVGVVARPAAGLALLPGLDQTRTVGLVTLPGAFVGVLLAGAPPEQAGAAQLLVLVALLAAQAVAAAVTVELVATGRVPVDGNPLAQCRPGVRGSAT